MKAVDSEITLPPSGTDACSLTISVDLEGCSRTALLKSVHRFTNRCYIEIRMRPPGSAEVVFTPKASPGCELGALAGEFRNDLIDQTLREEIAARTEGVRNLIMAHALSGIDVIHPELETVLPSSDPCSAGVPDKIRRTEDSCR